MSTPVSAFHPWFLADRKTHIETRIVWILETPPLNYEASNILLISWRKKTYSSFLHITVWERFLSVERELPMLIDVVWYEFNFCTYRPYRYPLGNKITCTAIINNDSDDSVTEELDLMNLTVSLYRTLWDISIRVEGDPFPYSYPLDPIDKDQNAYIRAEVEKIK